MNGHFKANVITIKKKQIGVIRENENSTANATTTGAGAATAASKPNANNNNNCNNSIDLLHCKRRMDWTKQWLIKNHFTLAENLLPDLKANEIYYFNEYFKMTEKQFRYLVNKLSPSITQQEPYRKKKFFSAEERLAISLKYLATGEFHSCKHYCFKASQNVILNMIADICLEIYKTLKDEYIKFPKTTDDWRNISQGFVQEFELPNCTGSLIARHVLFKPQKQPNVRNQKQIDDNTIIIMAIIDAYMNFIYVDIGQQSNLDDLTIFETSEFKERIENGVINIPKNDKLPHEKYSIPSFFVGNDSMPLKTYLMKRFYMEKLNEKQMYFDYKMWDVRKKCEYCIEILTNIFPILMDPFKLETETAKKITLGCIALYNFLKKTKGLRFNGEEDFQMQRCFEQFKKQNTTEIHDKSAQDSRNYLMNYVNKYRTK